MKNNIHPIHDRILSREEREKFLNQKGMVIWMTGLSGSGKSTIAIALEKKLFEHNFFAQILDGDNIRHGINSNLGFSIEDRKENIRRIAEVAKLYKESGIITICSFISPTREMRQMAKEIIGKNDFFEMFIDTPLEICEQRDVKGLYAKARAGEIKGFTGIDSPYQEPENPDVIVKTETLSVNESVEEVFSAVYPLAVVKGQRSKVKGSDVVQELESDYSRFENLDIWKEGIDLAEEIFWTFRENRDYGFKNQIYKSSVSIPSNIAEGYERKSNKEFIQFLYIAKASCGELRTQLILGGKFLYITEEVANRLISRSESLSRKIANFIKARQQFT
jgi:adenylylsulfate kinase